MIQKLGNFNQRKERVKHRERVGPGGVSGDSYERYLAAGVVVCDLSVSDEYSG